VLRTVANDFFQLSNVPHFILDDVSVYSFGMLLYDMTSLEDPIKSYMSSKRSGKAIIQNGVTPRLDGKSTSWFPPDLLLLMKNCWDEDPSKRPTFERIKEILEDVVDKANSGADVAAKPSKSSRPLNLSTIWNNKPKAGGKPTAAKSTQVRIKSSSFV